jgi:L-asparaginase
MPNPKKSVCILATGGTISMQKTSQGYAPVPGYLEISMAKIPELQNEDMPHYVIHEFKQPIDSANMTPDCWQQIGEYIEKNYHDFDGFVILHGTDTMAYSASALSFMLENLNKPVILTGSQLPLFETRSDARENLINALWLAGNYAIPEVCIYFNNKLFRGNRTQKIDAMSFSAFSSPNFPVLGKIGTEIRIRKDLFHSTFQNNRLQLQTLKPSMVNVLRIFPGMSLEIMQHWVQPPLQALILQTYGVGTAPEDPRFLEMIRHAVASGIIIVNCSQCPYAKVRMSDYAASSALSRAGAISGGDMTAEATLAKLFYLFSKNLSVAEIKERMVINLRGELTVSAFACHPEQSEGSSSKRLGN